MEDFQNAKAALSNGPFLDSKDALVIYTSVAVSSFGRDKDKFAAVLKNLKMSFAEKEKAVLLGDFKKTGATKLTLPFNDSKEYVKIIRNAIT